MLEVIARIITQLASDDIDGLVATICLGVICIMIVGGLIYFGVILFMTRDEWRQNRWDR